MVSWKRRIVECEKEVVAIKITLFAGEASSKKIFDKELSMYSKLRHKNIVSYIGGGENDKKELFILMELMEMDLHVLIERKNKRVKWREDGRKYVIDMISGLIYLQNNKIIHRDLKSPNILISGNNAKICDFGMAKSIDTVHFSSQKPALSVPWCSPEQYDVAPLTFATDIYSLGVIIWEILSESTPPWSKHLNRNNFIIAQIIQGSFEINHQIPSLCPESLKMLLRRCWKVKISERPNLTQMLAEFIVGP